jgi:hypothetical protein
MNTEDFSQTWRKIYGEKAKLIDMRTNLETELVEVRNKISHLDEVLRHLAPLADVPWFTDGDISQLGLTDAIRNILKHSNERLSAQDVRQQLNEKGYDLSSLSVPMASIYKILSRLADNPAEVEREKQEGKVFYKWVHPPISDEDIPF